jgi:hypothetical protein
LTALAVCCTLATSAVAQTAPNSSAPGSTGTGEKHPETVPPELLRAKPMPLPSAKARHIVLRGKDNRTTRTVRQGTTIEFRLADFVGSHWTCDSGEIHGTSVQSAGGVYKAISPGSSVIGFSCWPPSTPGRAHTNLTIGYFVTIDVQK